MGWQILGLSDVKTSLGPYIKSKSVLISDVRQNHHSLRTLPF